MNDPRNSLFVRVADSPPMAAKIAAVKSGKRVFFGHVAAAAQPFLVAVLAKHAGEPQRNLWVVCETERAQEQFHAELSNWLPEAAIFPHQEVAAVEGALPDPETSAERLAVLQRVSHAQGGVVVVVNKDSFADQVPSLSAMQKSSLKIQHGTRLDRGKLIEQLAGAGYESAPQVTDRGNFRSVAA